jgi:hypothetical protein
MEMEQCEAEVVAKKRHVILDRVTLLEKSIKILDLERFMWTKQNNDKHIEHMENWKDIVVEEEWASETGLVPLFLMGWKAPMLDVILEFLNTILIKGTYIYFGHKDKVYVINKKLIIDVFGVCVERYVEELKGHVCKSLAIQAL